uniref:Uncharacterized protein n=1 Tax=Caenorhabditis tropicalis TaxID=1561998 RepID=A0A1I7TTK8_9PELO
MVKRITVYTAFGQFINMVERQAEIEKQEKQDTQELETDRYPFDNSLSDYQNALNSDQDIRVQSCPADFTVRVQPVKKSISCPFASFAHQTVDSKQKAFSPVPTTIETRKMNEATELMMSFWKVHVTSRKPKMEEDAVPSLFENIEGLFSHPSTTSVASLFGKFEELFEEMVEVVKEQTSKDELMWTSPDQTSFPQLPVFVKSPVDSLKIYKGSHQNTDEMADDEMSSTRPPTVSSTCSSSASSTSSSTTIISKPNKLLTEVRLQRAVIDEQKKIIDSLYTLQYLNQRMANLRSDK